VLGIGLGWREEEFDGLHVPMRERVMRLEDSIEVYRQAWGGELVTGGELLRYPSVAVRPRPATPAGPPIWIGAMSEPAARRAGRLGDGFMATEVTASSLAEQVATAREARRVAGRDDDLAISVHLPTFAWRGGDAWERVRDHHRYVAWKYDDMDAARSRAGDPPAPPPITPADERTLHDQIVVGTPDEVVARIAELSDAVGGELHYIARLYWPGMDRGVQREALALFAEEVIPQLR
jgi:alkanesulfonate monooxygenase SsuD/methylene tetrahydromethanopterin reductase-like flavin-dependent oxidoreductase (luciferase family)